MATILMCPTCAHPISFRDPTPTVKRDWEHEVKCKDCGTELAIIVRITVPASEVAVVNKPS
jgi:hypothetical protein